MCELTTLQQILQQDEVISILQDATSEMRGMAKTRTGDTDALITEDSLVTTRLNDAAICIATKALNALTRELLQISIQQNDDGVRHTYAQIAAQLAVLTITVGRGEDHG
jgi:hypothetical protein